MKRILIGLSLVVFTASVAWSQGLTPDDVARMEYVTSAHISPDGKYIAYTRAIPADPKKENTSMSLELHLHDVDKGSSKAFVTQGSVGDIAFRPGHRSLTFTAKRDGDPHSLLYEIPLTGGEAQVLYEHSSSILSYHWHPDGEQILIRAYPKSAKKDSKLPYSPEIYESDLRMVELYHANVSEGGEANSFDLGRHITGVKWSPAGDHFAVSAAPTSLVDDYYTSQRIYMYSKDGQQVGEVDHQAKLGDFAWSPDGQNIAFIGGIDKHDPTAGRILISPRSGGKPRVLAADFKGAFDAIHWKDNKNIHFLASEGVYTSLGSIGLDGKIKRQIDKGSVAYGNFSFSDRGALAMTASTASHPGELFYAGSTSKTPKRLTTSNDWLDERQMGQQEVVTYTASDGLEIEGVLIRPVDEVKGQRYPLITVVHGGPEAHYDHAWLTYYSMAGQMAAAKGYAVFYPNYRGSTGRGVEFIKTSQGDPAGKEFDDIIDGIDHLIESGLVDGSKVGVTGGSYGGYATAWMSTRHTDRFAAGVMFVGISDNISKWGTSDIPEEMFLVHSLKRIWDDYEFFLERSPIFYAGQAQTPLLIMHGKEDTRVNPGQSYELYRHIKTRTETPVRLVLYPGEGHGNRKATARYDYNLRMLRWFDHFLKSDNDDLPPNELELE